MISSDHCFILRDAIARQPYFQFGPHYDAIIVQAGGRKSQPVQQSFRCNSRRELEIIHEHKMKTRLHHSSSYLTEQARRRAKNVQDPCGISGRRSVGQYQGVRSVATIKSPVRQSGQTDKPNYAKHSSQPGPSPVGMPSRVKVGRRVPQ